jgi:hypothetical protein
VTATLARTTHPCVWLTSREAHRVLGICWDNVRKVYAAGTSHAHKNRRDRSGEWLQLREVAVAARRGASLAEQVRICGCTRPGWSPPPCRAGRSRRHPL